MRSSHCHHQGWHGKLCAYCYLSSSETFPIHQNISNSHPLLTYRWLFIHSAYLKQVLSKLSCAASFLQVSVSMQNLLSPLTPPMITIRVISYPKDLPSLGKTNIQYATKYKLVYLLPCAMSAVARSNVCKSSPITGLDRPRGFQEVTVPRFSWQRHRMVVGCQPNAPAAFTPGKYSWYSFLLEAESTPGP